MGKNCGEREGTSGSADSVITVEAIIGAEHAAFATPVAVAFPGVWVGLDADGPADVAARHRIHQGHAGVFSNEGRTGVLQARENTG